MRKFGKSKVEYFEFQLEGDETVYRIPLAAHVPYSVLNEMRTADEDDRFSVQVKMMRMYMGEVVDTLTAGMLSDIIVAWADACNSEGASVGES